MTNKQIQMNASLGFLKAVNSYLPPVQVLSVDYLENVAAPEGKPRLSARNQIVIGWIVVEMWLHIYLAHR